MKEQYKRRRAALMHKLPNNAVVVMAGAHKVIRSGDQFFPFWQYANFHYLTEWPEADAVLVIRRHGHAIESLIFHHGYNEADEKWHGKSISHQEAVQVYGFDQGLERDFLDQWLKQNISTANDVYATAGDQSLRKMSKEITIDQTTLEHELMQLRLCKDDHELQSIKLASDITVAAHIECMREGVRGKFVHESSVAAAFEYQCTTRYAEGLAYEPIAASAENACILHYTKNNAEIQPGTCVLLDAGCTVDHYCADVTRCWPISGKFTQEQRCIYELVLHAHQACINKVAAGVAFQDLQVLSKEILLDGLKQLRIVDQAATVEALFGAFYGHGIGHSIGLDVHDPSPKRKDFELKRNMVVTIEPGLYLKDNPLLIKKSFAGIGIRIEDDILVQEKQGVNLTAGVPVAIDQIESLAHG